MVPFVDLSRQHNDILDDLERVFRQTIMRSAFTLGEEVGAFEQEFARYCGVDFGIGTGSGTDALYLALKACGVRAGDEVITAPNTFIATAEAISKCGARPVFTDIDGETFNIDPDRIEEKVTSRTRAIVPVHLYGRPADMDPIMALAKQYGLKVVEDACQAHGALYKGRRVGSLGDAGCFSFYPSKNLGALGDGGIVVTGNSEVAASVRLLRSHGESEKNHHTEKGECSRLHGLQAALLRVKLPHLDQWNAQRVAKARLYSELLAPLFDEFVSPTFEGELSQVFHLFVIRTDKRDRLMESLLADGVGVGVHYPIPIHLQPAYSDLGYSVGDFPVAERLVREILSLPLFPEITDGEILEVGKALKHAADHAREDERGAMA